MYTTISAMLVEWSAMRSRYFAMAVRRTAPRNGLWVFDHIEEQLVEYLLIQVVNKVVGKANPHGEVGITFQKRVQTSFNIFWDASAMRGRSI